MRTVNRGGLWTDLTASVPVNYLGTQGDYDTAIAVHPDDPGAVYVGGQDFVLRTLTGLNPTPMWDDVSGFPGAVGEPHVDHHALVFTAGIDGMQESEKLLDGNDGGIWRLEDPYSFSLPLHWTNLNNNLQITQFVGIATHPTDPNTIYGGSQDNGTEELQYPGGSTSSLLSWDLKAGGDGGTVRVDPVNPNVVYHEFQADPGSFSRLQRSRDGGATWTNVGAFGTSKFYAPYVIDPEDNTHLIYGAEMVYSIFTSDDTNVFGPISPRLWMDHYIDAVAVAPTNSGTIYAAVDGKIFVTTDGGTTWPWPERDVRGRTDAISQIVVNPFDDRIAYAVSSRFNSPGRNTGHVFMTTNYGMDGWHDISDPTGGSFPDLPTWSFAVDPGRAGEADDIYYAGTDDGVYAGTFDPASSAVRWARVPDGLPRVQVHDLEWNANLGLLTAGTYGRGAWQIPVSRRSSIGPDAFGYTAGSTTFEHDQYQEIFGQSGTFVIMNAAHSNSVPVDLGTTRTFTLYGTPYTGNNRLFVSSEGLITFGSPNTSSVNTDLTTSPLEAAIAPLWSDWVKDPGSADPMVLGRFEDLDGDGVDDRLVIEWYQVKHSGFYSANVNFQAVLYLTGSPNAGDVCFNYRDLRQDYRDLVDIVDPDLHLPGSIFTEGRIATVGIKAAGFQGPYRLLVSFNNLSTFVGSDQAICFSAPRPPSLPGGIAVPPLGEQVVAVLAASTTAPPSPLPLPSPLLATTPVGGAVPLLEIAPLDALFAVTAEQSQPLVWHTSTPDTLDPKGPWPAAVADEDPEVAFEDAQVHGPWVQVDPGVESVLSVVEAHRSWSPWVEWGPSRHRLGT
jgi:hypothetical protein